MRVRLRITLLFALLAFIILSVVCSGIYYFSYKARINAIRSRLTNRSITTARLLSQEEVFSEKLVERIDSSTSISIYNKTVQAYDRFNRKIYDYSDHPGDTIGVSLQTLKDARTRGSLYFVRGKRDVIAYHYTNNNENIVIVSAGEDREAKESLHTLLNILLLIFMIGNIIILVLGYIFSGRLLKPIEAIARDVEEISAQNLTRRIQTGKAKDEWYQLSSTLNELLNRLQDSFELQRRFISNASHELSTPLASISSQLQVSLQRERTAEEYRKVMVSVHQDVNHMSKLTQTLLEFAKASGDPGGLEIKELRIDEIILQIPAEIIRVNPEYSVIPEFKALPENEEDLLVFGNEPLLVTAIKNIVINACKYSNDHQAFLKLSTQKRSVVITVEDNGIGIPREEIENIFQPFYRVEENRTGGFGLGLSLARRIVKLHKGIIDVASRPGKGTIFTIRLPAARKSVVIPENQPAGSF